MGFPCYSTREDLSVDVSITNVRLILTKLRWFQLFATSQNSNFKLFWKKKSNFLVSMVQYSWRPFHWCINYQCRTDIDEAKVISALRHKSNFEFRTFLKEKNRIFGFSWCSTREDLSIDVSITNVGLILTKLRWFLTSFLGVQTDRHSFGIRIWKHVGTQKISSQSSKLVVSRRSLYASPEDGDA